MRMMKTWYDAANQFANALGILFICKRGLSDPSGLKVWKIAFVDEDFPLHLYPEPFVWYHSMQAYPSKDEAIKVALKHFIVERFPILYYDSAATDSIATITHLKMRHCKDISLRNINFDSIPEFEMQCAIAGIDLHE